MVSHDEYRVGVVSHDEYLSCMAWLVEQKTHLRT